MIIDVDECLTNNGGCDENAICMNTPGSFNCSCKIGYSGDGFNCYGIDTEAFFLFTFFFILWFFFKKIENKDLKY